MTIFDCINTAYTFGKPLGVKLADESILTVEDYISLKANSQEITKPMEHNQEITFVYECSEITIKNIREF